MQCLSNRRRSVAMAEKKPVEEEMNMELRKADEIPRHSSFSTSFSSVDEEEVLQNSRSVKRGPNAKALVLRNNSHRVKQLGELSNQESRMQILVTLF